MPNICGLISCSNLSKAEDLIKLSRDVDTNVKASYSAVNCYNTFIGLTQSTQINHLENIIYRGVRYICTFCGELYNVTELSKKINSELGYDPMEEKSFAGIVTWCYILWGGFSPKMLDGKFAYAIYSEGIFRTSSQTPKIFLSRDKFGFIPIYYCQNSPTELIFSTSLGSIIRSREKNYIDNKGLWQIFFLDGKSLPGYTHIKDIYELNPGCCAYADCRDTCKIMIKSYDKFKDSTMYDTSIDQILKASKNKRGIDHSTQKLNFNSGISTPEIIENGVKTANYPILPNLSESLKNIEKNNILYSNIGCELTYNSPTNIIKGFFPWIIDPYCNLDILNKDIFNTSDGYNFINSIRLDHTDYKSQSYYIESIYRFYLPMTLKHIEKYADYNKISIKYPFCDYDIYAYLRQNREIKNSSEYSKDAFESEFIIKNNKLKESENAKELCEKIEILMTRSDSVIRHLCDKSKLSLATKSQDNVKALSLIYAFHSFVEEFDLDFMPCKDC